jgi:Bacterial Ig-like domain (group 1)/Viral BACON domain
MKKVRGSQARVLSVLVLMIVAVVPALHAQTFSNIPALSFTAVANGANPLPQLVTVASTGAAMNFSVTPSTSSGGSWLTASPTGNGCCTTPEGITVSVNVASLAAGTYSGQIIFAEYFAGTPSITVPVTLTVAPESGTFFGDVAGQASFSMATGGGAPPSQSIRITNGGTGTLSWTVTKSTADGGSWLNVPVTSGTAPAMVTVGITPSSLPGGGSTAGTFIGQLLFQTTGSSVTIPVSVTVGTNAFTQVNPINFTMPQGGDTLPQVLSIASTGTNFNFSSAVYTGTGGNWLSISNSGNGCCTTPEAITVSVDATVASALAPGTYVGEIVFLQYFQDNRAMTVPVSLTVAAPSTKFFDSLPGDLSFYRTTSETPAPQAVNIRNGGTGTLTWTATASTADGGKWLKLSAPSGTAPSTLTVSIIPAAMPGGGATTGTFDGQVVLKTGNDVVTIPVSVVVGANVFAQVNPIAFTVPEGGNALPQVLAVASTGANFNFSSAVYTASGGNWLTLSNLGNGCCTTPDNLTVGVDASTLSPGIYAGEIVLKQYFQQTMGLTVPVTLTVIASGSAAFFDSLPGQISFSLATGAVAPAAQNLQIRNAGSGTLRWTGSTTTADGGKWLTMSALTGTAPSTVRVSINPAALPSGGLAAGTFNGQVVLQTAGDQVTIPVSVTVGANVFAQVNAINFTMLQGAPNPLPQILDLASTGSNFNFSSAVYTASGGNWLSISNPGIGCCTTPEAITVNVNASTLPAGTYMGEITFIQYFQQSLGITVPVTLTVEAPQSNFFDTLPGQMSFFLQAGGTAPSQSLQIRNAGSGTLSWTVQGSTADGGAWLTVSPGSGNAPSTVTVSVVTKNLPGQGLTAGTFNGQLVFTAANDVVTIPIGVVVGPNVFRQQNAINFVMLEGGANPLPQILPVVSAGTNFNFSSAVYTASGGNWLSISNLGNDCCTTPDAITVSVNASTLLAGTYTGEITFVQYFQRTMLMTVPVTLTVVRCGALFDNVQGQVSFSFAPSSSNPPSQTVKIRAAGSGTLSWTLTKMTSDGGNWLTTSATGGNAPSTVTIGVNTAALPGGGLTSGTFTGELVFKAPTGNVTIPVSVLVGANVFSQGSSLSFSMTLGGSNPLSQIIAVASTGSNFSFSASATTGNGGAWLKISPTGTGCCSTPSNITASVSATTLPAGIYTGQITFIQYFQQTMAMTVPVTLTITDPHIPATIKATGGTPQSVTVNKNFASLLLATVQDASANPVSGVLVTFNPPTTGASGTFACGNTAVTNANGIATAQVFKANTIAGKYTVTATANALTTSPGFVMTNNPGPPASIAATAGTPQSAPVNTAFATNLAATVTDVYGNPVPNNTVTFSAPTSGASGSFAGGVNTAKTNSAGVATAAVFKANTVAGSYTVTAGTGTLITNPGFALTNLAGAPATITATGGTPQTTAVNTAFANPLQATVNDSFGNPVAGATVTFTAPTSGASGTFAGGVNTAKTNSAGVATSAVFTANGTAGSYTVTGGTGTVTTSPGFQLTNQ